MHSTFRLIVPLLMVILLGSRARAESLHGNHLPESREEAASAPRERSAPQDSANTLSKNNSTPLQSENEIVSNMLVFWSMARGESPPKELLANAGIKENDIQDFQKGLKKNQKLNPKLLSTLRKDFAPEQLPERLKARKRFMSFAEEYQKKFPAFGDKLAEILTAWGEARNLSGFTLGDSLFQQAKIASVIHVLRNRFSFLCNRSKRLKTKGLVCTGKNDGAVKWALAVKRYQFSAFEPYDPNLAELAAGPQGAARITGLESLPGHDQRAISNLARTLLRMERNEIQLASPLGDSNTRHYLTPNLLAYSKSTEEKLAKQLDSDFRRRIIRIPQDKPKFLSMVPKWADPKSLIQNPSVLVLNPERGELINQQIPPKDFVYFQGLL